jgi:2-keto-4-pentenoate hydratase/2-oxohepta-3-ene-1,7-dioic acid hydratase in catechol pathway
MKTILLNHESVSPSKIICVGKNYLAHIREMGGSGADDSADPTIFIKPNSAIADSLDEVLIPLQHGTLHHEVELCFVVGKLCRRASEEEAASVISAWGVGIDFTLRDRQSAAKKAGGPWTISKCFDNAAVFGEFVLVPQGSTPLSSSISLKINGELRQSASTSQMVFSPTRVVSFVSQFMTILPGDVFMTGTPEGVGEVKDGDRLEAEVSGLPRLAFSVRRH